MYASCFIFILFLFSLFFFWIYRDSVCSCEGVSKRFHINSSILECSKIKIKIKDRLEDDGREVCMQRSRNE